MNIFGAGEIVDMKVLGVWEPFVVKTQTVKTAIESATVLLRIDDIVSGIQKKSKPGPGQTPGPQVDDPDQVSRNLRAADQNHPRLRDLTGNSFPWSC